LYGAETCDTSDSRAENYSLEPDIKNVVQI
jgi:hypothetical protein